MGDVAEQKQHTENVAKNLRTRGWPAAFGRNGFQRMAFVRGPVEIAVKIGTLREDGCSCQNSAS